MPNCSKPPRAAMRKPPLSVPSLTDFAHQAIGRAVCAALEKGGGGVPVFPLLVDATAGNGYDTAFLARLAGEGGRVVAFDVQRAALDAVRTRLEGEGLLHRADLVLGGHEHMEEALRGLFPGAVLTEGVSAVSFNLGFLPGSDKRIVTQAETTLEALDAAARLLRAGVCPCMCTRGMPEAWKKAGPSLRGAKPCLGKSGGLRPCRSTTRRGTGNGWFWRSGFICPRAKGAARRRRVRRGGCPRPAALRPTEPPDRAGRRCVYPPA